MLCDLFNPPPQLLKGTAFFSLFAFSKKMDPFTLRIIFFSFFCYFVFFFFIFFVACSYCLWLRKGSNCCRANQTKQMHFGCVGSWHTNTLSHTHTHTDTHTQSRINHAKHVSVRRRACADHRFLPSAIEQLVELVAFARFSWNANVAGRRRDLPPTRLSASYLKLHPGLTVTRKRVPNSIWIFQIYYRKFVFCLCIFWLPTATIKIKTTNNP